jgi:crotonobetainyl-CoA:carnitine CoA-transferase CaiB-like acyl-CoA transferase
MRAHDADEWQRRFVAAGSPGAKVTTIPEAFEHPHVALRNMLVSFDHPVGRHLKVAGNPVKMSNHPFKGFRYAPGLGADTRDVLGELLGMETASIDALRTQRVVWWPSEGEVYDRPSVV